MEENSGASESDALRSVPSFKTRQRRPREPAKRSRPYFAWPS